MSLGNGFEPKMVQAPGEFFRQLLAGRPRQEIVSQISRLIENRGLDKAIANGTEEIRWPKRQSMEPNPTGAHKKPIAWPTTSIRNAADQRFERTSLGPK